MTKVITAVFNTRPESEKAIQLLEQAGFTKDHVSLIISEEARDQYLLVEEGHKTREGAEIGLALGGLTGALYLGLGTAGLLLVPGLNLIVSGALIGGLVGLSTGAVTGGLIGALVGFGVPEHEAKIYEEAVRKGAALIAVEAKDSAEEGKARAILNNTTAQNIKTRVA